MTTSDWISLAVGVGTLTLAGATYWSGRITVDNQRKGAVPVVRPADEEGEWIVPEAVARGKTVTNAPGAALYIENLGPGHAIQLQWELTLTAMPRAQASIPRSHTFLTQLRVGERTLLWQRQGNEAMQAADGTRLSLWADDVFGAHYLVIFDRHGPQWVQAGPIRKLDSRPDLFGPQLLRPSAGSGAYWSAWSRYRKLYSNVVEAHAPQRTGATWRG